MHERVVTSLGAVRPHTRRVADEVTHRWPLYFVWGIGPSGEHAQGRALDFMGYRLGGGVNRPGANRSAMLREIATYLWTHRARLGVWYVIYNRRIISITRPERGWIAYTGSNPHTDHVHVSFTSSPPAYRPPQQESEEEDMPITDADVRKIWEGRPAITSLTTGDTVSEAGHGAWTNRYGRQARDAIREVRTLVRELVSTLGDMTADEVEEAIQRGIRAALDPVEIAELLAPLLAARLGHELDTASVVEALREVFGSLGDDESEE